MFRAVFKRDREGFLLDHQGKRLPDAKARDLMRAIQVPCQVVRTAGRMLFRLLSWNPWQGVFLRLVERLHGRRMC